MEQRADQIDESMIRAVVHQLWVQRGRPTDSPEVDWYQAERLLHAKLQGQSASSKQSASSRPDIDDDDSTTRRQTSRGR